MRRLNQKHSMYLLLLLLQPLSPIVEPIAAQQSDSLPSPGLDVGWATELYKFLH